jgi:hypothetical protein
MSSREISGYDDYRERNEGIHCAYAGKEMKPIMLNKYSLSGILLLVAAAVFIVLTLISEPGAITTAALAICALVCIITGVFSLTFSAGEPVDPHLVGILPTQGCITICRLTHHLGMHGHAYFLPPRSTGETRVMQFNPILTYDGKEGSEKGSFREKGPAGLVTTPSCDLLIEDLKKRYSLKIPDTRENISLLLRETLEEALKCAPRVSCSWSDNTVTITFHDYQYIDGCKIMAERSPQCCAMSPCPVCSLCGALITEGLDTVVTLDKCLVDASSRDVTAVFSIVS